MSTHSLLRPDPFLGLLSSKTKPVASVSGQSSGCCITPTGYRAQRGGTSAAQPLNLSQVSARGCCLLFGPSLLITLWRTLLLARLLNKARWSPFCVKQFGVLWPVSYLHVLCFFTLCGSVQCTFWIFHQTSPVYLGRLEKCLEFRKNLRCFSPCLVLPHHMLWDEILFLYLLGHKLASHYLFEARDSEKLSGLLINWL